MRRTPWLRMSRASSFVNETFVAWLAQVATESPEIVDRARAVVDAVPAEAPVEGADAIAGALVGLGFKKGVFDVMAELGVPEVERIIGGDPNLRGCFR